MLALGVIEPSKSPWSSPVVLVPKPTGEYRLSVDFRKIYAISKRDAYPLPYISMFLDRLRNAKVLSSINLKSAYWQVSLAESSKEKTAFTVPGRGWFHFLRMPFGLHNAPGTWQRLVDTVVGSDLEPFVFVYLDDIIIATPIVQTHLETLKITFGRLSNAGLTLNRDKCEFARAELKYLGYIIDRQGPSPDPEKVRCMVDYPTPSNVKKVRRFVGLISWYRRFVPNFPSRVAPLHRLTKKNQKFEWTPEVEDAFLDIKQCLVSSPILTCPDFARVFTLQTDASQEGLAASLRRILRRRRELLLMRAED